ncbi:MAG: hypothetical protein KIH64_012700 [Mycobacterium sp.]|nr:hypothetical protein [Mycobacterium sp.]
MTKKMTATLFTALAMASVPATVSPVAQAEICGEVGGRHVAVSDCGPGLVGLGVDAAVVGTDAAVVGAAAGDWGRYGFDQAYPFSVYPAFPGEVPCISPAGLPYYTPGAAPCYP